MVDWACKKIQFNQANKQAYDKLEIKLGYDCPLANECMLNYVSQVQPLGSEHSHLFDLTSASYL